MPEARREAPESRRRVRKVPERSRKTGRGERHFRRRKLRTRRDGRKPGGERLFSQSVTADLRLERVAGDPETKVHHRGKIVLALRQWGFGDIPPMPLDW